MGIPVELDEEFDLDALFEQDDGNESLLDHLRAVERTDRNHVLQASRDLVSSIFRNEQIGLEENLLEIGCGIGYFCKLVPDEFRNQILQTDPSAELLEEARKRHPEGRFQTLDALNMEGIPDESVDRIFAMSVFNYLKPDQIRKVLAEIRRVLRKGGRIYSFLDLQPGDASILETTAQARGIPLEHATTSVIHSNGITLAKVIDTRTEHAHGAALAAMLGGDSAYVPTAYYHATEVLTPLFREFFPSIHTSAEAVSCTSRPPALFEIPLIMENTIARMYGAIGQQIPWLFRKMGRVCDNPRDAEKAFLGRFRKWEVAGMFVSVGVKE